MVKLSLILFGVCLMVAVSTAAPDNGPRLTGEASRTRFPGGRTDSFKVSQDAWRSKDGKWSAGGYVQHDRTKYGGHTMKDTHG
ncbi:hypothetical protein OV760_29645, partial [Salmonella enterica subsp. enterica serovar 1,4,[5],12:i:-]|nr:hypothetical protein [Salmonella enterica subsp. enterica serovar 1,4,[5],12:i:-]